jgi:hypothetical protein
VPGGLNDGVTGTMRAPPLAQLYSGLRWRMLGPFRGRFDPTLDARGVWVTDRESAGDSTVKPARDIRRDDRAADTCCYFRSGSKRPPVAQEFGVSAT